MKVTDVYNDLLAVLSTAFPSKTQLPNPYDVADNNCRFLTDGYGIAISGGVSTERFSTCTKKSILRTYTVWLTRQITTTENNINALRAIEILMYEDQLTLINGIEKDTDLQASAIRSVYADDSGTSFIEADTGMYYALATTITVEYIETLN